MKVSVKIEDIEVVVDRPNFGDDMATDTRADRRKSIMIETIIPTLKEAVDKAKELYELKKQNEL